MNIADIRIIKLIDLLKYEKKILTDRNFCDLVDILPQTLSKIRLGTSHFTVQHIEAVCKIYNVNSNWIYGFENNVYREKKSIEIKESELTAVNK